MHKPTSAKNIKTSGALTFSGSANGTTLYTNSLFTGSSVAEYRIENNTSNELIVRVYSKNAATPSETIKVPARTARGGFLYVKSSNSYYLRFYGANSKNTNFSGSVKHSR